MVRESPEMTESEFRREYLAEFLEDQSEVFRNYKNCIKGEYPNNFPMKAESGHRYVIAADLGRARDYTVITVLDRDMKNHLVYHDRFNKIEWTVISERLASVWRTYNHGKVIVDSTGVGDAFVALLQQKIPVVDNYNMGGVGKKATLIETLIGGIEQANISFPNIPVLIRELDEFTGAMSSFGNMKYNAPKNKHDDCVDSLALAYWLCKEQPINQFTPRQARLIRRKLRL